MNTRLVSMAFAALMLLRSPVSLAGDYEEALAAFSRGDKKAGLAMLTQAANKGDARAQYILGVSYAKGQGLPRDYKQALSWFRKAAEQGHAAAQFNLGSMYANGEGVTQDDREAVLWYRKAAEQGDGWAQFNLGAIYAQGQGVSQDYVEAHKWFNIAAAYSSDKENRERATKARDRVAVEMTPAQIAEAQKRAREWKKR